MENDDRYYVESGGISIPRWQYEQWEPVSRWVSAMVEEDTGCSIQWCDPWWQGFSIQGSTPHDIWAIDMGGVWDPDALIGYLVFCWKGVRDQPKVATESPFEVS